MLPAFRTLIRKALSGVGYDLVRTASPLQQCTMDGAMGRLAQRGLRLGTVIDVGASDGRWSEELMAHFPQAQYLLVEAQAVHEPGLKAHAARHANSQYVLAAAGRERGEIFFDATDAFGGVASYTGGAPNMVRVPVVSIDDEIAARRLPGPYLLKLDTHGFEVPILEGAARTLQAADIVIMECYNFPIAPECLTFPEMCRSMAERGFRVIDLANPMVRPRDGAFWQMDLVFARATRPEFSYLAYR